MRVSDMFPSKYLRADDLNGRAYNMVIDRVAEDEIDGDNGAERKFVVYFNGADKGLVLNKTNAFSIAQIHGDDTTAWIGKPVELYPATVTFQGRPTPCIRVRLASGQTVAQSQQTAQVPYGHRREPVNDPAMQGPAPAPEFNDEVPF